MSRTGASRGQSLCAGDPDPEFQNDDGQGIGERPTGIIYIGEKIHFNDVLDFLLLFFMFLVQCFHFCFFCFQRSFAAGLIH